MQPGYTAVGWARNGPASATNRQLTGTHVLLRPVWTRVRVLVHTESTHWLVPAEWVTFIEASIPASIAQ